MLPNALQPSATDHVPVLAEEVRELLAVQPGRDRRRRDLRRRRPRRAARRRPRAARPLRRDRPRPDRRAVLRGLPPPPRRRADALPARRLRRRPRPARRQRRPRRRDPARPRRLEHADRPARARLLVRGRRAARHAHGSDAPALGRATSSTRRASASSRRSSAASARSATRGRSPRHRAPAQEAAVRAHGELVETIKPAIPAPARFGDGHPAKRVFQALRIAVNDELGRSRRRCRPRSRCCGPGGRLAVISFHSLEDRIVKRFLRDAERGCVCPPDFPVCVCGREPALRASTAKADPAVRRGDRPPTRAPPRPGCAPP